jgi:hypothetical protein
MLADHERFSARLAARDRAEAIKAIDEGESRRVWDWGFRRSWDRQHRGGLDRCPCDAHRMWRREV